MISRPKKIAFARTLLSLLSAVGGWIGCGGADPARPNLVLITVDRLAADRLGCFGGANDALGSVCALGQRGTLFAWTVSAGGGEASGAATVLTSLSEAVHGVGNDGQSFLANAHPSIAEDLSRAGYATAAFITSPRLNRSRRLNQGFDLYDDRLAFWGPSGGSQDEVESETQGRSQGRGGSIDRSGRIGAWIEAAPSPWFVWIHANRDAGLVELDRLISRLSQAFDAEAGGPGILFVALRGERGELTPERAMATDNDRTIGWRTHRVPLIWRPPTRPHAPDGLTSTAVSRRLASLLDIAPTLRAAARLPSIDAPSDGAPNPARLRAVGRDLSQSDSPPNDSPPQRGARREARFLLLHAANAGGDVGLASQNHLYTRHASPLDGTGRPVPTSSLIPLAARFATLAEHDPPRDAATNTVRLEAGRWRQDVLDAHSPVPRLEFHLARQLGAERVARQDARKRRNLE